MQFTLTKPENNSFHKAGIISHRMDADYQQTFTDESLKDIKSIIKVISKGAASKLSTYDEPYRLAEALRKDTLKLIKDLIPDYKIDNKDIQCLSWITSSDVPEKFWEVFDDHNLGRFLYLPGELHVIPDHGSWYFGLIYTAMFLVEKYNKLKKPLRYDTAFPNFKDYMMHGIIEDEVFIEVTPIAGIFCNYTIAKDTDENKADLARRQALTDETMNSLITSIGVDVDQFEFDVPYQLDSLIGEPVLFNLTNRSFKKSESALKKGSLNANIAGCLFSITPHEDIFRTVNKNYEKDVVTYYPESKLLSNPNSEVSGERLPFQTFDIRVAVRFEMNHTPKENKKLIVPSNKSYKFLDNANIALLLDTFMTIIANPEAMYISGEKISNDIKLVLKPTSTVKDMSDDKQLAQSIGEAITKQFGSSVGVKEFIREILALNNELGFLNNVNFFNYLGSDSPIKDINLDFGQNSSYIPANLIGGINEAIAILNNMAALLTEASNLITKEITDLEKDTTKKVSLRVLLSEMVIKRLKLDPTGLLSVDSNWIKEIAKAVLC